MTGHQQMKTDQQQDTKQTIPLIKYGIVNWFPWNKNTTNSCGTRVLSSPERVVKVVCSANTNSQSLPLVLVLIG
ncbi:hypothetical protein CRE_31211 [Caenorhabditis remanei]|uniref:Uncharacterized protein n=1 Tax=Caenorhabditis remanei TaxID=31234 RepID=E3MLL3_CAERE|nr:hypothetical protein CRE_31211 [Caenorhabditis remanei]